MSSFNQRSLPDFDNPPVVETVLSVQFERLSKLRAVHFGLFWSRLASRFPDTEERPPLAPMLERFPDLSLGPARVRFEAIEVLELPRLWMHNPMRSELIQLQIDKFVRNWRKQAETGPYPHYEPIIKPAFEADFRTFQDFLADENLGPVRVNQCEVTYVNHIVAGEGWEHMGEAHNIFTFWNATPSPMPGNVADMSAHFRCLIGDERDQPVGRLHVDVQPAARASDNRPMYVMNLTARGQLGSGTEFFDLGREWIVKSFDALTTDRMHRYWRKK